MPMSGSESDEDSASSPRRVRRGNTRRPASEQQARLLDAQSVDAEASVISPSTSLQVDPTRPPRRSPTASASPLPSPPASSVPFAALSGGDDDEEEDDDPVLARQQRRNKSASPQQQQQPASPSAFRRGRSPDAASAQPRRGGGSAATAGSSSGSDAIAEAFSPRVLWRQRLQELLSLAAWLFYIRHAVREMGKRRCNFCLGLFSCFLVVLVAGVCFTLIARAPVVFLQQAESSASQLDLELTPAPGLNSNFINYTVMQANVALSSDLSFSSPRSFFAVFAYPAKACPADLDPFDPDWKYTGVQNRTECNEASLTCLESLCPRLKRQALTQTVSFVTIDTVREQRMGLGRLWPLPALNEGEVVITQDLAASWGLRQGDVITIKFALLDDLNYHWHASVYPMASLLHAGIARGMQGVAAMPNSPRVDGNTSVILDTTARWYSRVVYVPFTVRLVLPKTYGKFVGDTTPRVVAEAEHFLPHLLRHVHPILRTLTSVDDMVRIMLPQARFFPALTNASRSDSRMHSLPMPLAGYISAVPELELTSMQSWATHVCFNMPNRIDTYLDTNFDVIQARVIGWSSRVIYYAGLSQVSSALPVLGEVSGTKLFSLYLGLILSIILTILFLLSMLLIYSLLMISIESRSFELGVHRMCGMSRVSIVKLLLVQALSFAIPAWVVGLVMAQIIAAIIVGQLEASVEVPLPKLLTERAIGVASVMGLLIPLLASILPIREALGTNLQSALDTRHSKTIGVKFEIERSVDGALNLAWLAVGVGTAVLGFSIYFLMPLALLSLNLTLLIHIFFALLLGMLLGLILLSLNLQPVLERAVVFLTLWWERRALSTLTLKNLITHRVRNRKTSIMFALSLGFILFITAQFQLELWTAKARMFRQYGGELVVYPSGSAWLSSSSVASMETLLARHEGAVAAYGWVTPRLMWNEEWDDTYVSNIGHAYSASAEIYGVSSTLFEATFKDYLVRDDSLPPSSRTSLSEQLYTAGGSQAALLATSAKAQFGLQSTDGSRTSFLFALQNRAEESRAASLEFHRMRPMSFLDVSPRFNMGRFPTTRAQPVVVSLSTFQRLSNGKYPRIADVPLSTCIIRVHPRASAESVDALVKSLGEWAEGVGYMRLWDVRKASSSLAQSDAVMGMIFSVATYIAIFLCLFSLVASMLTNIMEQAKEIAVLRALGMTRTQLVRVYTYEAFTLVLSASILGLAIGFVMSATMVAQRVLLTQLPVPVTFPFKVLLYTATGSAVCALVASWAPARELMKKPIASILKSIL